MFDEFGPRGAEDEREGFWTDLSEVPDEQYRDEDEPKQTQEVIVPPAGSKFIKHTRHSFIIVYKRGPCGLHCRHSLCWGECGLCVPTAEFSGTASG